MSTNALQRLGVVVRRLGAYDRITIKGVVYSRAEEIVGGYALTRTDDREEIEVFTHEQIHRLPGRQHGGLTPSISASATPTRRRSLRRRHQR